MLKESGKLLKLLVILQFSKSSCPVAVTSGRFGLSWKVSPGRTASGLQPGRAGPEPSQSCGASLGTWC